MAGIILYHSVEHFNIFTQETIIHALPSDQTVADILAWLLSGKMYGIFAMLFGLSFFIMNDNLAFPLRLGFVPDFHQVLLQAAEGFLLRDAGVRDAVVVVVDEDRKSVV